MHGGIWQQSGLQCTENRPQLTHPGSVEVLYLSTTETAFLHNILIFFPHKWVLEFYVDSKRRVTDVLCECHGTFHMILFSPFVQIQKPLFYVKCLSWHIPSPYIHTKAEENGRQYSDPKPSTNQRDSELRILFKKKINKSLKMKKNQKRQE